MSLRDYAKPEFERLTAEALEPLYTARAEAIRAAREVGVTWREIAEHLELTPLAAQNAAKMGRYAEGGE